MIKEKKINKSKHETKKKDGNNDEYRKKNE